MTQMSNRECEYGDCSNEGYVEIEVGNETFLVCQDHEWTPEDQTGYCTIDCQMGHGCDESC